MKFYIHTYVVFMYNSLIDYQSMLKMMHRGFCVLLADKYEDIIDLKGQINPEV